MERKTINHATMETLTHPNRMFPLSNLSISLTPFRTADSPATGMKNWNCRSFSPEASVTG